MFKSIIRSHSEMMLNPFFEPFENAEEENECFDEIESDQVTGNTLYLNIFQ